MLVPILPRVYVLAALPVHFLSTIQHCWRQDPEHGQPLTALPAMSDSKNSQPKDVTFSGRQVVRYIDTDLKNSENPKKVGITSRKLNTIDAVSLMHGSQGGS